MVMSSVVLDRNALYGLFENQKKLDDLFDSIFDANSFYISSAPAPIQSVPSRPDFKVESPFGYNSSKLLELFNVMKHHPYFFLLPIALELTVIYWVVTYLL